MTLHPHNLFHIGIVVDDIDAARQRLSDSLGLQWKGGRVYSMELHMLGADHTVEMRIAHSVQGPPHLELIESVPGSVWDRPTGAGAHHLCYWAADSVAELAKLEAADGERILGAPGSPSGYVRSPDGLIVEIIPMSLRDHLAGWLAGERG